MLAWMAYSILASALLVAAGAILEQFSPWLSTRRRFAWLAVIAASLAFIVVAAAPPTIAEPAANTRLQSRSMSTSPTPAANVLRPQSVPITAVDVTPAATVPAPERLDLVLVILWALGSALCFGILTVSAWRIARMRRGWREGVVAGVPVFVSHDVGPAVIGLVHHGIVVPAWVESLGADAQRTVMTHEREHVRAGDPLLLWGATLLVSLAPWNPAMWYALRRLRHAIEIDCDARVLRSRPDAHAYCTLLLDVGERTLAGVAPVAALAEPATLLERRIDAMTAPVRVKRGRAVGSAVAAVLLVSAACVAPRPQLEPRARVLALVNELGALLARDSVQRSLTPADRERIARDLSPTAQNTSDNGFGQRVVELAHAKFPQAFDERDDAAVVTVLFDSRDTVIATDYRRFPLPEVFDMSDGTSGEIINQRNGPYLMSRVVQGRMNLQSSSTQTLREAPHTIFMYARLMAGEPVPTLLPARRTAPNGLPRRVTVSFETADSIAKTLYPSAYAPHEGIELVGLVFSPKGQFVKAARRVVSHDDVFAESRDGAGESAKDGVTLLSLVFTGLPALIGNWSTTAHRSDIAPAIVWLVLEPGEATPTPRTDAPAPLLLRAAAPAHATAQVTLSPLSSSGVKQAVLAYSTNTNGIEADMRAMSFRMDTLRMELPFTLTLTLNPGADVHFISIDGKEFNVSADISSRAVLLSNHGVHMVLENGGSQLRARAP